MAEIITFPTKNLNVLFKDNQYKDIFVPLILGLNDPAIREISPFVQLAAVRAVLERIWHWGGGAVQSNGFEHTTSCVCNENGVRTGYCVKGTKCPKPLCPAADNCDGNTNVGASARNAMVEFATSFGAGDPFIPLITNFEQQLTGIRTTEVNAYVDLMFAKEMLFANVDFIKYFTIDLEDGVHGGAILKSIGGYFREDYKYEGIDARPDTDGTPGIPADPGSTSITYNVIDIIQDASYFLVTTGATTIDQISFDLGSGILPPLHPVVGYTVSQISLVVDPGLAPNDFATAVAAGMLGIPNYASVIAVGPTVTWTTLLEGFRLASEFISPVFSGEWTGVFDDGADLIPGTTEGTLIDFQYITVRGLIGTFFKLFTEFQDEGVLFYYEEAGHEFDPATLGTTYTTAIPITLNLTGCVPACDEGFTCLPGGGCAENQTAVMNITTAAIVDSGFFTATSKSDGCCFDKEDPCPNCHNMLYSAVAAGDWANADGGTANLGIAYQVNEVISPAGTSYGFADGDLDFARLWNANVPEEMAELGRPTHYLQVVAPNMGEPCFQSPECSCESCRCDQPCDSPHGNVMLQTMFPSISSDLAYNAPATTFVVTNAQRCPTCLT